jgi:hypothetical protein
MLVTVRRAEGRIVLIPIRMISAPYIRALPAFREMFALSIPLPVR